MNFLLKKLEAIPACKINCSDSSSSYFLYIIHGDFYATLSIENTGSSTPQSAVPIDFPSNCGYIIVPCGRYDATKKQWHKSDKQHLFNEFVLVKVSRAMVIDAINQSTELTMPTDTPKKWMVDCRKTGFGAYTYPAIYIV